MQREQISSLIKKYNAGNASKDEKELVESWYMQFEQKDLQDLSEAERAADLDLIWNKLPIHQQKVRSMTLWYRVTAAAAILLFISIGVYYITNREPDQQKVIQNIAKIAKPGGNQAILILGNGKQVVLTGANNGTLTTQGSTAITKTAEGKVVYQSNASASSKEVVSYNTMVTPVGGTYNLTLADGTKVMLDAASSIHYPVTFTGNERKVEITGQAYFEVAHNKAKPFRVTTNGQTVEVLGTHFNINAYTDEGSTKTTLLEGSVKITNASGAVVIKPGQQSVIAKGNTAIAVKDADVETATAWKDGIFRFKRADLQTVMHQFSRWYNVEVVYEGDIPQAAITGKVLRNENATHMLEILSKLGIRFRMEGKKIVIIQK
jgi:transmembrane sensor